MNRNLKYIAFAMVSVALSSCSSTDEPNACPSSEDYICFGMPTVNVDATLSDFADNSKTRAIPSWTTIDRFQVWGFCVPNNISGTQNASAADQEWNDKSTFFTSDNCGDVLHDKTVATDDGFAYYNINNNNLPNKNNYGFKIWDNVSSLPNARYAFIAGFVPDGMGSFSMAKGFQTTNTDETGKNMSYGPKLTFTIAQNGSALTTPLDYTKQPDALVAAKFDHRKRDGRVSLSFFHFMTGIRFKFHNYTSDKVLRIKNVTYSGKFHKTAVFDFTTDNPVMTVKDSYSGIFTLFNGEQSIPASAADYMSESGTPVTLLLLPNPDGTTDPDGKFVLGSNKEIKIVYSIGDGPERTFTYGPNFTLNYIPKPNTLHTAHFNFVGDEFVVMFQADENNWQNGSDNNVTIN